MTYIKQNYNKKQSIKEVTNKNIKTYIVNVRDSSKENLQSFDSKSIEIKLFVPNK